MPVQNAEIAAMFDPAAELLEIEADNPFRIRADRRAHDRELAEERRGSGEGLSKLPGGSDDLAGKIAEISNGGSRRRRPRPAHYL